jgi:hypothetical protein
MGLGRNEIAHAKSKLSERRSGTWTSAGGSALLCVSPRAFEVTLIERDVAEIREQCRNTYAPTAGIASLQLQQILFELNGSGEVAAEPDDFAAAQKRRGKACLGEAVACSESGFNPIASFSQMAVSYEEIEECCGDPADVVRLARCERMRHRVPEIRVFESQSRGRGAGVAAQELSGVRFSESYKVSSVSSPKALNLS